MLARGFRQHAIRVRRQAPTRRFASDAKKVEEKATAVEVKAAEATEGTAATKGAETHAATATPEAAAADRPGFFSRHPEIFFLAGLVGIGGYIYRSSVNNKKFNEIQNEIAETTPISPFEAYELRSQNTITPDIFDAVKKQAKRYFPSNEATVAEFDLCLGSVLQGSTMKNTHHLERVLLSLPKSPVTGKVNLDLLLVAFSLAVKGNVDERLACLFNLPFAAKAPDNAALKKEQVEEILGHVLDTYQVPSEKRVVALEDKAYPYQEYAIATPDQLVTAAIAATVKAKSLEAGVTQYDVDQFGLLMKSKAICVWGECYNTSSKKRMKN
ncbi:Aste57867_22390 [Aphanomyces stellatus]|uniref:Aste57867_22390 protein n=1 Tax=Aphanomyces stellatus TaxID=120398 RepID=A0A485LPW3_9STRA|nr:hypothetical protein As57867_022320 [Aphanomyces stellatus]VFT99053.1 Aste57867_22390 [Aphanomyces stellatus]